MIKSENIFLNFIDNRILKYCCLLSLIIFVFSFFQKPENIFTFIIKHGYIEDELRKQKICYKYIDNFKIALYYSAQSVVNKNFIGIVDLDLKKKKDDLTIAKEDFSFYYQIYNPKKYIILPLDPNTVQIKITGNNSSKENFKKNFFLFFNQLNKHENPKLITKCEKKYHLTFAIEFNETISSNKYVIFLIFPLLYIILLSFKKFRHFNY